MSQKSRHTGDVEIVALGTGTNDSSADGTITLRYNVIIPGDLTVQGETTSVETTNTEIKDRIITLNKGETGAGVTLSTAGLEIDRGSLDNVFILWNETNGCIELKDATDTGLLLDMGAANIINVANPVNPQDAATKDYVDNTISVLSSNEIYQDDTSVTVTDPGVGGVVDIVVDGNQTTQFNSLGLKLYGAPATITTDTGTDLNIIPATRVLTVDASTEFKYQVSAPSSAMNGTVVYADSSLSDTQLGFKTASGDEGQLVSKRRAILYGLIF